MPALLKFVWVENRCGRRQSHMISRLRRQAERAKRAGLSRLALFGAEMTPHLGATTRPGVLRPRRGYT